MRQPFDFIPARLRRPLFIAALIWTLSLLAVMQVLNKPLINPSAQAGIVSFELAGTPERARDILASWSPLLASGLGLSRTFDLLLVAAFGLGLDYLFMPSYAITLALGVLLAAGRRPDWFASLGPWIGWGSLVAAVLDATENVALWYIVRSMESATPWPQLAFWCASIKFCLIALGILYSLTAALLPRSN